MVALYLIQAITLACPGATKAFTSPQGILFDILNHIFYPTAYPYNGFNAILLEE
jgi:hypothetical protein